MAASDPSTSKPPAGASVTSGDADLFLDDLRRGEREAFVGYYGLFRAPVHDLLWRLSAGAFDAASATRESFTRAYRDIILSERTVDLDVCTYRAAFAVSRELLEESGAAGADGDRAAGASKGAGAGKKASSDLGRRFIGSLEGLEPQYKVALLLHDVHGLEPAQLAGVFDLTEDAAAALLFKAREDFRGAFQAASADRRAAACRLAEQTAAGAVGRRLSDVETRRLRQHAGYCRQCRKTMRGWGDRPVGLALFLDQVPLPKSLEAPPVFGEQAAIVAEAKSASRGGLFLPALAGAGHALRSRTAAYVVAAACAVAAVAFAVQDTGGVRTMFVNVGSDSRYGRAQAAATVSRVERPEGSELGTTAGSPSAGSPAVSPAVSPAASAQAAALSAAASASPTPSPLQTSPASGIESIAGDSASLGTAASGKKEAHREAVERAKAARKAAHAARRAAHRQKHAQHSGGGGSGQTQSSGSSHHASSGSGGSHSSHTKATKSSPGKSQTAHAKHKKATKTKKQKKEKKSGGKNH